jgi:hypothetical protein
MSIQSITEHQKVLLIRLVRPISVSDCCRPLIDWSGIWHLVGGGDVSITKGNYNHTGTTDPGIGGTSRTLVPDVQRADKTAKIPKNPLK